MVIIAVLLVIVVAAIVVLLVTGKKDTDKKEEPVSMSFDDYVNDAKEYESEGDKDKAYNSYLEAYKLNKSSEEVLDYLIDNTEDVTLKLNYVYEYLDLTAESSKGSDRRRELFDYLLTQVLKRVMTMKRYMRWLNMRIRNLKVTLKQRQKAVKLKNAVLHRYLVKTAKYILEAILRIRLQTIM